MSRKHKKQNVEEPVVEANAEVIEETTEEDTEMKEKTGILKTIGGAVSKAVHSKPGKIVLGVVGGITIFGAGVAADKAGLLDFFKKDDESEYYDDEDEFEEDDETLGIDVDEDETTE